MSDVLFVYEFNSYYPFVFTNGWRLIYLYAPTEENNRNCSHNPKTALCLTRSNFFTFHRSFYCSKLHNALQLLRLDTKLSEGTATYDYEKVSIEHVLPQRPGAESEWVRLFPTKEIRDKYVNRLGNLVLLSRGKNMKAENFDFKEKTQRYFKTNDGISSFALTTQVLREDEWTPAIIDKRQGELMSALKSMWKL